MKKMLFIGAMLIVGMTAFGGRVVDLGPANSPGPVSGDASLGIITKGEVVDESNKVLLVVKPTLSAGDDDASLHFRFGDMKAGTAKVVDGEFTVEVLNKGQAIPMTDNLTVKIKKQDGTDLNNTAINLNKTNTTEQMGTLKYTLTEEKENSKKLYTGKIVSNIQLEAAKTGSFSDNSCYVDISLSSLNITN